ncbi:MAG: FHA domain-containing protein [Gammaproteobacteria bacterium]|nr:FHA domain-containing protein [Gammaproteobacteria bacterium]
MSNNLIRLVEGRTFVIGREGHIFISSITASKRHAELKIIDGRTYLRDLNSTNGTYLLKNNHLVYFDEGYVNPLQPLLIGDQKHTILSLLAIASDFIASDDSPTQANFVNRTEKSRG